MDTLRSLRSQERIVELDTPLYKKQEFDAFAYVRSALTRYEQDCILVFTRHTEDMMDIVLNDIDPEQSGRVFFASELIIDPINNKMVPKHRLATQEELDNLAKRKIPINKLPILRMRDPIRRWYNFPKNSVVAIERSYSDALSKNAGLESHPSNNIYFRKCK